VSQHGKAKRRFGQHFLEAAWVDKLIRVIDPKPDQHFWEIGPGRGALTRPLAARAASVTGFEIDRDLAADLRADPPPRFTLVEGDFLDVTPDLVRSGLGAGDSARVVGNLPYNVASPILFKLAGLYRAGMPIADATVMLQREVADRLVAEPGSKEYGVLSILIQHDARAERILNLPPGAFRPAPKVHSAVVRLVFHPPAPAVVSQSTFVALTQAIFTRRRKTLTNALLAFEPSARLPPIDALRNAGIDGTRRPETLSVGELARLSDVFARAVL
jgi:16S rRNA (adenine1518-N6/adenine1519-N6)-dimethyltransferase